MKFGRKFVLLTGIIGALGLFGACGDRNLGGNSTESGITGTGNVTTAPTVTSISPANLATNAYRDASLQINFSTVVNTSTVTMPTNTNCSGFSIVISTTQAFNNGDCIAMNQTVSQSGSQITVRANGLMSASTTYYVRITTAVASSTGLTMLTQYTSQFTTGTDTTPLPGAFGTCAGANILDDVRSAANGAISLSVPGLIVTAVDTSGHFFVQQAGATGPAVYIRDTTNNPNLGVQVGDILCLGFAQKSEFNSWMQIDTLSAAQKTTGGGSVAAQALTVAASETFESEMVMVDGTLTTKSSTLAGGGYNHTITYAGGTLTIREIQGSGKLDSFVQGQAIRVTTALTQFTSYQLYIDNRMGTITESTSGNFNVSSASTSNSTTVVLTFNNTPNAAAATAANYTGNNGLTISGVSVSGITATLTTSTQTVGQSYTITVANVLRNADSAALSTNNASFTGYAPPATFTTGQVIINEVHLNPSVSAEEYVELYNTTASAISLNNATIWYKSDAGTPGQATTLTGVIPANGYYTVLRTASPSAYTCTGTLQTTGWGNSGLSNSQGAVILTVDGTTPTATSSTNVRDIVQWGTNSNNWAEGSTGPVPASPRSMARSPNGIDTNNNSNDFLASTSVPNHGTCGSHNWPSDVTAPTITASTPAVGATGVALSSTISVTFSESMYVSSVTTANLYLVQGTDCNATGITGTISATNPNTTFTFPSGTLTANTQYSICIKTGVEDVALNNLTADAVRSFTTIAPDVTPPTVASTTPASGASGVAVGSTIAVTFSEAMSTGTVTAQTSAGACSGSVQVSTVANNFSSCIAMTASAPTFSGGNTIATFTPASALSASTTYHIRVTTGVQDVAGNALAAQFTTASAFTTQAADVTPPTISSTTPIDTGTGIATSSTIVVTFSEAMNTGTVTAQTSTGACSGSVQVSTAADNFATTCIGMTTSAPTFSGGNTIATFTPAAALAASTTYKIRVTTAVTDASSNALSATYTHGTGFTTAAGGATTLFTFTDGGTLNNLTPKCVVSSTANNTTLTNAVNGAWDAALLAAGSTSLGFGNQGANGLSVLATGTTGTIGAANCSTGTGSFSMGVADRTIDTTGRTGIQVTWTGRTISASGGCPATPRTFAIRLQYSIDGGTNFSDATGPSEYVSNCTGGHNQTFTNVTLPAGAENISNLVVRWRYYAVDTAGSGTRPKLAIDEITVTGN